MNGQRVLTVTALVWAALGTAALFLPAEVLAAMGAESTPLGELAVQLYGTAVWGLMALNWSARGSRIGGIYGRPIVMANLFHAFAGASTLSHAVMDGLGGVPLLVVFVLYVSTTAVYFVVLRRPAD